MCKKRCKDNYLFHLMIQMMGYNKEKATSFDVAFLFLFLVEDYLRNPRALTIAR